MYSVFALLLLVLLFALILYASTLDWRYSHSKAVAALPVYNAGDGDGDYQLQIGDFNFRARYRGAQNEGDALIMLHGFPESLITWDGLGESAAAAGYRALAFDQRGYSPGARPDDIADYDIWLLVDDVIAVADHLGFERFHLVGHDWGAGVGWAVVAAYPERVLSWTGLSIPQTGVFMDGVVNDPEQRERSKYFGFIQRPIIPEFVLTVINNPLMNKVLDNTPNARQRKHLDVLQEPGALTAAMNWYRAMDPATLAVEPRLTAPVTVPTRFIWGTKDGVIAASVVERQRSRMQGPFDLYSLDAGHGLMHEQPDTMAELILGHIGNYTQSGKHRIGNSDSDSVTDSEPHGEAGLDPNSGA